MARSGPRPTEHSSKSWIASILVGSAITLFTLDLANAGYWYRSSPGGCGNDGIQCALDDFYYYSEPTVILDGCQYSYGNGVLVGAQCSGHTIGGASRSGLSSLECYSGEKRSSTGCINEPPPDRDRSCAAMVANPVDVRSGMKIESRVDFSTHGESALKFERFYASNQTTLLGIFQGTRLGRGWRSNFDSSLNAYGSGEDWISIVMPTGENYLFKYLFAASAYVQVYYDWSGYNYLPIGSKGPVATFSRDTVAGTYTLTTNDGTAWTYSTTGRLQSITAQNGYTQTLTYDANGNNTLVTDSFNRTLAFTYSPQGLATSVTVPGGQVYNFTYLARYNNALLPSGSADGFSTELWALEYVIQPDSTPSNTDNPRIRYHYENASFPFALTGITNEAGVRFATWSYEANGRVATSEHAGGVEQYSFSYNDPANTVTVTNPLSKNTIYHLTRDIYKGTNQLTRIQGQASSNCVASDSYLAYDSNTFLTDETDAEGRITHYVRDGRGNPTTITRAYGTPAAQSNTYTWHSTPSILQVWLH